MSTKKKGMLTVSGEWAKHLRPYGKRRHWKQERKAGKQESRTEGGVGTKESKRT
jgi:hypothetical protein